MKRCIPNLMSDKYFIRVTFKNIMGYELDLNHPCTFNEKLQWLKLNTRDKLYTQLVDKNLAKTWISSIIGDEFIVPTIAVYNNESEIDLNSLPNRFVLKCNHDCGSVIVCKDKAVFDLEIAKEKLKIALRKNYYWDSREWPYKSVKRKIIAEQYLGDNLQDYRIYCFNGQPRLVYSYTNHSEKDGSKPEPVYCDIFDTEWHPMPFRQKSLPSGKVVPPTHLDEMLFCAQKLSSFFPHVRVDFYETDKPYIGELTFFPGGGFSPFYPNEWDKVLGSWLVIPTDR